MSSIRESPRGRSAILAGALALLAGLCLAGTAHGAIYWYEDNHIDRANLDGSVLEDPLIDTPIVTAHNEDRREVPIAVYGGYLYWVEAYIGTIERAPVGGGYVEPLVQTNSIVGGLAVTGSGIYWVDRTYYPYRWIGHADLDGTNVNPEFVDVSPDALGTITANESHIFWTGRDSYSTGPAVIGTADSDGSNVNRRLIEFPYDLEHNRASVCPSPLTASSSHLYWINQCSVKEIGRAGVDGSAVTPSFLSQNATGDGPCDLAVGASYLYWMLCSPVEYPPGNGHIGRSGLDGLAPDARFLDAGNEPDRLGSIAVDELTFLKLEKRLTLTKKKEITCALGSGLPRCAVTFECRSSPEGAWADEDCVLLESARIVTPEDVAMVKGKRKKKTTFARADIDVSSGQTAKVELTLTAKGRKLIKLATTGENRASKFRGTILYGSARAKVKIKLK